MSGYGPFGFSQTLAYVTYALNPPRTADKPNEKGSTVAQFLYLILRFLLAIDMSLIFELMGAFLLTQFGYDGYDFKTHKKAEAIVFIGGVGGAATGLALVIVDIALRANPAVNDTSAKKDASGVSTPSKPTVDTVMAGCVVRMFLWPGLAALGGLTGTILWHLRQDTNNPSLHQKRGATGAVVQTVGALIVVSAPTFVQFIGVGAMNLSGKMSTA
ncbi:hypothetical protein P389DRAFT_192405 [Cystobasidium minutum MCA 4210]|uniref:uncharacterized protein n=1 Tax=Cystobasidium minutum MCA 4210 TaxID=1397322 RepID=UPI0034CE0D28|eukprot:jgi/Rhomi1/192405/gm1.619_g